MIFAIVYRDRQFFNGVKNQAFNFALNYNEIITVSSKSFSHFDIHLDKPSACPIFFADRNSILISQFKTKTQTNAVVCLLYVWESLSQNRIYLTDGDQFAVEIVFPISSWEISLLQILQQTLSFQFDFCFVKLLEAWATAFTPCLRIYGPLLLLCRIRLRPTLLFVLSLRVLMCQ